MVLACFVSFVPHASDIVGHRNQVKQLTSPCDRELCDAIGVLVASHPKVLLLHWRGSWKDV